MIRKISNKDKKDWENFLSKKESLPDKDLIGKNKKINNAITLDLHGYSLDEANKEIKKLIHQSFNRKVNKLKIITGKGLHSQNDKDPYVSKEFGILKYSVPEYIKGNQELMDMITSIEDASVKDGGSGAFYIFLKRKL